MQNDASVSSATQISLRWLLYWLLFDVPCVHIDVRGKVPLSWRCQHLSNCFFLRAFLQLLRTVFVDIYGLQLQGRARPVGRLLPELVPAHVGEDLAQRRHGSVAERLCGWQLQHPPLFVGGGRYQLQLCSSSPPPPSVS